MWWLSALGTLLLATALTGLPVTPNPDAELVPEVVENATLSTELMPPPINAENKTRHGVVYLINLYAVTNSSDLEDGEERLTDEVVESMPGILEPVATVLLVVEADDEETPVSLDEIAKELEDEGFSIKKVEKDGETKVIKVDFGDVAEDELEDDLGVLVKPANSLTNKVRRKRAPCLKCKLGKLMGGGGYGGGGYGGGGYGGGGYGGGYGGGQPSYGGGGGGCGGGCGGGGGGHQGGGGTVGVIPVVVVPVQGGGGGGGHYPSGGGGGGHYPSGGGGGCGGGGCGGGGGGHYPSGGGGGGNYYPPSGGGGHAHPGGGQCDVCAGRGGGGGGGGGRGGSWSQSSAQASAQSSSGTW